MQQCRWWQLSEAVNAVVEDHAARNAEKLARSGKSERHLFVLIDSGEATAWSTLLDGDPVGASYSVTSCDLRILMDQPTESISPHDASSRHDDS
jgi:hypothetical protein